MRVGQNANWDALVLDDTNSLRIYHMLRVSLATFGSEELDPEHQELMDLINAKASGATPALDGPEAPADEQGDAGLSRDPTALPEGMLYRRRWALNLPHL